MIIFLIITLVLIDTTTLIVANANSRVIGKIINYKTKGKKGFLSDRRRRRGGHCYNTYGIIITHRD